MWGLVAFAVFLYLVHRLYKWNKGNSTPPPNDPPGGGPSGDDYPDLPPIPPGTPSPRYVPDEWLFEHLPPKFLHLPKLEKKGKKQ